MSTEYGCLKRRRSASNRRGGVVVFIAITITLIVAFAILGLETAFVLSTGQQLQSTADAAALAGARLVRSDDPATQYSATRLASFNIALANQAAKQPVQLELNPHNAPTGDIVVGTWDGTLREFSSGGVSPNAVRVVARRTTGSPGGPVSLIFGMFGASTSDVSRSAVAVARASSAATVVVLNPAADCALDLDSNAILRAIGGTVHVNSSSSRALCADSNSLVEASAIHVVGAVQVKGNAVFQGTLKTGAAVLLDPLASLAAPVAGPDLGGIRLDSNQTRSVAPGYYSQGISLDSNSTLYLQPGIYVLDGIGLAVNSNSRLSADGVMLHIIDSTPGDGVESSFRVDSNGLIEIRPPGSGPYAGISIFQARQNRNEARIDSNGALRIEGILYFPVNGVRVSSNGALLGNQLLAYSLVLDSNAAIDIDASAVRGRAVHAFLAQ